MDKKRDMISQLMNGTKAAFIMIDDGDTITAGAHGDLPEILHGVGIFIHSLADQSDLDITTVAAMVAAEIITAGDDIEKSTQIQGTVTKSVKL